MKHLRLLLLKAACVMLLASCFEAPSPPPAPQTPSPIVPETAPSPKEPIVKELIIAPLTLDEYKREFARRVAFVSTAVFQERLPEMLKSVVVLDVTIDRNGNLTRVSMLRSNGFRELETVALGSVRRGAPYAPPAVLLQRRDGTINFLETFLFRDDGRFQIRSLVTQGQ